MSEGTPGPKPQPQRRLMDAAVDFAAALEAGDHPRMAWDKLRKAALAYRDGIRPAGRPSKETP